MKKTILFLVLLLTLNIAHAQVASLTREQKISVFNENAKKNAAMYAAYKPTASFAITDEFKATYKYLKAWIQDDVLRIATDAKIGLCYAKVIGAVSSKPLCSVDHNYQQAPVFSDKFQLSELRAKMPGGTYGNYQVYIATSDGMVCTINFDASHIVQSPNAAPIDKGPKLNAVTINFGTMDHDKEAGKWVAFKVTRKPRSVTDYYKYVVAGQTIEDPAKWDYGDNHKFSVDTKSKNIFLSDFAGGGNISVTNMPNDIWDVTVNIRLEFADGTVKAFRKRKTSNPGYGTVMSFDFDKDFKIIKEYE